MSSSRFYKTAQDLFDLTSEIQQLIDAQYPEEHDETPQLTIELGEYYTIFNFNGETLFTSENHDLNWDDDADQYEDLKLHIIGKIKSHIQNLLPVLNI